MDPVYVGDYSAPEGTHNTPLTPMERAMYLQWVKSRGNGDIHDYDMQAFWKENPMFRGEHADNSGAHFTDRYKKPNHQTFSDESQYSTASHPGGTWIEISPGKFAFMPSPQMLAEPGRAEALARYMKSAEPDVQLRMPPMTATPWEK